MARELIDQKLESLRRCVTRVEAKMPATLEELKRDLDAQDIVALNLTRAVQICIDIAAHWLAEHTEQPAPQTMGQTFEALGAQGIIAEDLATRLKQAVGFRNVMVHSYDEINWAVVFAIGTYHIADFRSFAQAMSS